MLETFKIRRLDRRDSLEDLTSMLHRAFAPMGRRGISCTCFNQTVEATAQRVQHGDCFVTEYEGRIVGTVTLRQSQRHSECHWYRQLDVASLQQLAVDPIWQGMGCGTRLLRFAAEWARKQQFHELALDTPASAVHLIELYESQGFRRVDQVKFHDRSHESCVMSKSVETVSAPRWVPSVHHGASGAVKPPLFGVMV